MIATSTDRKHFDRNKEGSDALKNIKVHKEDQGGLKQQCPHTVSGKEMAMKDLLNI